MTWVLHNGQFLPADQPLIHHTNHAFRYGDALFETIRLWQDNFPLADYHFDRLYTGAQLLQYHFNISRQQLEQELKQLAAKNNCSHSSRIRLSVYRTGEKSIGYLAEATSYEQSLWQLNEKGWTINIYPHARKSCDAFANLKTANHLPYIMAGNHARESKLDESLVLNAHNNIADGSRTNIFLVINGELYTPALHQGCVNGVMRRLVIEKAKQMGLAVHQQEIHEDHLLQANEVFLTNALLGIRWVASYKQTTFTNHIIELINKTLPL